MKLLYLHCFCRKIVEKSNKENLRANKNTLSSKSGSPKITKILQIRFYPFFALSQKPETRTKFPASWSSGNEVYFCLAFIASFALLQRCNRLL